MSFGLDGVGLSGANSDYKLICRFWVAEPQLLVMQVRSGEQVGRVHYRILDNSGVYGLYRLIEEEGAWFD